MDLRVMLIRSIDGDYDNTDKSFEQVANDYN